MNYLVDTHVLIWWITNDPLLSSSARYIIENPTSNILISVVSFWEIIIKQAKNKLQLSVSVDEIISQLKRSFLPITISHIQHLQHLPPIHQDPFDRILITQSIAENAPLITDDQTIKKYPIQTIF